MALVILIGYPLSGKSTLQIKLREELGIRGYDNITTVIDLPSYSKTADGRTVKKCAASSSCKRLKSTVSALLHTNRIIMVDAAFSMKSFRFELYCMAKKAKFNFLVIRCQATFEELLLRNAKSDVPYDVEELRSAVKLFEEPELRNKWDQPLTYRQGDDVTKLCDAIVANKVIVKSINQNPSADFTSLPDLNKATKDVCNALLRAVSSDLYKPGQAILVDGCEEPVYFTSEITPSSLAKMRQQFTSYVRTNGIQSNESLLRLFVAFVNGDAAGNCLVSEAT